MPGESIDEHLPLPVDEPQWDGVALPLPNAHRAGERCTERIQQVQHEPIMLGIVAKVVERLIGVLAFRHGQDRAAGDFDEVVTQDLPPFDNLAQQDRSHLARQVPPSHQLVEQCLSVQGLRCHPITIRSARRGGGHIWSIAGSR